MKERESNKKSSNSRLSTGNKLGKKNLINYFETQRITIAIEISRNILLNLN